MNGYGQYPVDYAQNNNQKWPYVEAKNYSDWQSILAAMPHLKTVNAEEECEKGTKANGIVIRSANDDNVHKAIKFGIWTTTPKNKGKIEQLWQRKLTHGINTYLFFSAVKSGMFEGVARLKSGYHEETFPFWWENHTLKFKGYFQIEWVYIKDVNNKHFSGLYNVEGEEVVKSKDCDTIDSETTLHMLNIFGSRKLKRCIFQDFAYMDEREFEYIRKMYEYTAYYNQYTMMGYNGQRFDLTQINLGSNPLNMTPQTQPQTQMQTPINVPPSIMKPQGEAPGSNLGFQMNPVSKNSKKK